MYDGQKVLVLSPGRFFLNYVLYFPFSPTPQQCNVPIMVQMTATKLTAFDNCLLCPMLSTSREIWKRKWKTVPVQKTKDEELNFFHVVKILLDCTSSSALRRTVQAVQPSVRLYKQLSPLLDCTSSSALCWTVQAVQPSVGL